MEKTPAVLVPTSKRRKHLHIRGENAVTSSQHGSDPETPPHTWRKRLHRVRHVLNSGNTSTYVEKTATPRLVRSVTLETPPHTWRKLSVLQFQSILKRNTSTYVEKTQTALVAQHGYRKHLHIRGENIFGIHKCVRIGETPPHTWRKHKSFVLQMKRLRNTSTYVEKTKSRLACCPRSRKHLHIRGENADEIIREALQWETPPHTWRKRTSNLERSSLKGNTSTYVEKTYQILK